MARIVDINELVPEDIIIRYGQPAKDYKLPGDIDVATVFRLFEMFQGLTSIDGDTGDEVVEQLRRRFGDIEQQLLALFQQRDPTMTVLPFGLAAMGQVLRVVLGQLGLTVSDADPTPPPKPAVKRTSTVKSRKR